MSIAAAGRAPIGTVTTTDRMAPTTARASLLLIGLPPSVDLAPTIGRGRGRLAVPRLESIKARSQERSAGRQSTGGAARLLVGVLAGGEPVCLGEQRSDRVPGRLARVHHAYPVLRGVHRMRHQRVLGRVVEPGFQYPILV